MKPGNNIYFYLALIFAIWFALTGYAWTYLINVFISFPFAVLSFVFWRKGKRNASDTRRYQIIPIILILGTSISLITLAFYLVNG